MKKFSVAISGLAQAVKDRSVAIQLVLMVLALIASVIFKFTYVENLILGVCIGMVVVTEILNTCIEKLCDVVSPNIDERIKVIKDMAAGAVLFASLVAFILGMFMVIQHL